ncbi:purple acid phosphatase 15-like isoform X2 [Macadamia integrifolia]|uniref:purple acid phosphatase 15-like isoform X2 n=1 Tax=Macadamia integrifolia TaxID=60698 RepID=UPI001C4F99C8|nr:purple acid phosphatase 15-like isoform X2 [Macadamia integrifolia]
MVYKLFCLSAILIILLFLENFAVVHCRIPTTLGGSFEPVTVPFDENLRGHAVDLPDTDPRVSRRVKGFEPEQISVTLSATYDSVSISWITGKFQIGNNIKPLNPKTVASIVRFGKLGYPLTHEAIGYSLIYNQLYPFNGIQNYTSGIIHHARLTGEQYRWLERDLANVDRSVTPWLIATWHPPWYSTYEVHYREAECMRVEMEELLHYYGIDIVFNGHVSEQHYR